ncbi:MAG: DUF456 domain-containing protein [Marinilabiliales bacterium]|nr:MAG: DUF456 domain-containing protein [Marinilabiliales bacterium]
MILLDFAWGDLIWIIIGGLLMIIGLIGCFVPIIPGPPISFAGLWILQLMKEPPFTTKELLIFAGIAILVTVLDYIVPIAGAKKYGASKAGIWGSTLGLVFAIFFPILGPLGIIVFPFVGALIGELIIGKKSGKALKAAFGTFLGFLMGTLLKLIASGVMTYFFIQRAF